MSCFGYIFIFFHVFIKDTHIYFQSFLKMGYEIRSTNVQEQMLNMWKRNFEVKMVPSSKVCIMIIYYVKHLGIVFLLFIENCMSCLSVNFQTP